MVFLAGGMPPEAVEKYLATHRHDPVAASATTEQAVGWVRSHQRLMPWHRTRPLQTLFIPWLGDRRRIVVHAAMVALRGRGIVLAGPPRSGKSTTIAACAAAGMQVLGDGSHVSWRPRSAFTTLWLN